MASYGQIEKRLKRLEDQEIGPRTPPALHSEKAALWQRLLQQRDWSESARNLFRVWYADHGRSPEWVRNEDTRLLSQLTGEELDALGVALAQEIAREDDE